MVDRDDGRARVGGEAHDEGQELQFLRANYLLDLRARLNSTPRRDVRSG